MDELPEQRGYRVVLASVMLAAALAVVLVSRVTMRSVGLEWGVPSFGFPIPAYGYTGVSSGETWIALVPLGIDLTVAFVVTLPLSYAVMRRLRSGWGLALATVVGIVVMARLMPTVLMIGLGFTHVWGWPHGASTDCQTLWIGAPTSFVDYSDSDDVCVVRSLELLEGL